MRVVGVDCYGNMDVNVEGLALEFTEMVESGNSYKGNYNMQQCLVVVFVHAYLKHLQNAGNYLKCQDLIKKIT